MWSNVFCLQVNRVNLEICTLTCLQHPVPIDGLILEKNQKIQRQLDNPRTIYFIILLLLSNRALYWFTAVGSETVFYSNKCYELPDWLLPRFYCYFPPKPPDSRIVGFKPDSLYHIRLQFASSDMNKESGLNPTPSHQISYRIHFEKL